MSAACVIGVDLGGTKLLAGAVDDELRVHARAHRQAAGAGQAEVMDIVVGAVEEAREVGGREVTAVGFGIPSLIDRRQGTSLLSVHLPIDGVPFRDLMAERLGVPVFVDNDANAAMLAEWRAGAARGVRDAALLTLGTGIGGGLVVGGAIARGARGTGAELGHMVVDADGPLCQGSCPNRGCLEAVASGTALVRRAIALADERPDSALGRARAAGRMITGPLVTELAHDGDEAAREVLEGIGRWLGVGISSIVNALNPEVVVIGGGVIAAGELLLAPARAEMEARALPPSRDVVRILPARFGAESGMVGSALLALEGMGARLGRAA